MPDDHDPFVDIVPVGDDADLCADVFEIKVTGFDDLRVASGSFLNDASGFPCSLGRRRNDDVRQEIKLPELFSDTLGSAASALLQRAIVIRDGMIPARFGVAEDEESFHGLDTR